MKYYGPTVSQFAYNDTPLKKYLITTVNGDKYIYESTINGANYVMESLERTEKIYIEVENNVGHKTAIKIKYIVSIRKLEEQ